MADFLRKHKPAVLADTGNKLKKFSSNLIIENGYKNYELFPALEAAWPIVVASFPSILSGSNEKLQEKCDALIDFLNFSGRWDEWLTLSKEAEKQAIASGDWENAGWRAYDAGWVHFLRAQSEKVIICVNRAEQHWMQAGVGDREKAFAMRLRGLGHQLARNYDAAIVAFREAVSLHRKLNPISEDVSMGLNSLASVQQLSGDYEAAEQDYNEALGIAKVINYFEGIATYNINLTALAINREDWQKAETLARELLPLGEKLGNQQFIATNYALIAKALAMQDKKTEGLSHAKKAVDIYDRLGSPDLAYAQEVLKLCEEE